MNEELAMRTFAYLITHYKEKGETIINSQEIEAIEFLQKYYQQLQNNWNELKKWLEEEITQWGKYEGYRYEVVLDKMQELEGNNA